MESSQFSVLSTASPNQESLFLLKGGELYFHISGSAETQASLVD
jgi:hypothetical protein